ncbi:MAG: hypothetical protein R3Y10_10290 [Ferrimonas sp.]
MQELYIISPLANLSKRTRLNKLVDFWFNNRKESIVHVCWEREKGDVIEDEFSDVRKKIILTGGGYQGVKVRFMYFLWFTKVFFNSWFIPKGSIVWCLGFESTLPLIPASKIKKIHVIYDDADRFSMIFKMPKFIRAIVEKMEFFCSKNVKWHIVPSLERYDKITDKMIVIPNIPSAMSLEKAKLFYQNNKWESSKLIINVNGWLSDNRGIKLLYEVVKNFSKEDVLVYMSGKLSSSYANKLSELSNVIYLGHVSNHVTIASCFASDFVFTFYDPSVEINRYAESNKWGDAIMTNCGILSNSEIISVKKYVDSKVAITSDYNCDSLYDLIVKLTTNDFLKDKIKENVSLEADKIISFENYLGRLL